MKRAVLFATIASICLQQRPVAAQCDSLTARCDAKPPNEYVPAWGEFIISSSSTIGRFIELHMWWSGPGNLAAFDSSLDLDTLEPDALLPDNNPYATAITALEWQPALPTVTNYKKLPCAYIDTPIDDRPPFGDGIVKPTIGSACANEIMAGSVYYTVARVGGTAATSSVGLRFQRGTWWHNDFCVYDWIDFEGYHVIPYYDNAPYCIFSCCDPDDLSGNNFQVVPEGDGVAPGCYSWSGLKSARCTESGCANGIDDDWDALEDCADPDCTNSPVCSGTSICPSGDGYYCGDVALGQIPENLYYCANGSYTLSSDCNGLGCKKNDPGTPDECYAASDPCAGVVCNTPPNPQCQESSGTCVGGICEYAYKPQGTACNDGNSCTTADICDGAGHCGGTGGCENCDGVDNDGNGVIDDPLTCWLGIFRFKDPSTGARCWGRNESIPPEPPPACAGYDPDVDAFYVRATPVAGTFEMVQCSRLTDHILVPKNSADQAILEMSGHDCTTSLGYFYPWQGGPAPGTIPFTHTCPMYRFSHDLPGPNDGHIFTRHDDTAGLICEGARADIVTNDLCFASVPPGCP